MSDFFREMELAAQRDSKNEEIERLRARLAEAERMLKRFLAHRTLANWDLCEQTDAFLAGEKP